MRNSTDIPYENLLDVADVAQHWYAGQGDPVYALVSSVFAGRDVPIGIAEDAARNLNRDWKRAKAGPDKDALGDAIVELEDRIFHAQHRVISFSNPLARAGYRRHGAIQKDLDRYYKDCMASGTVKRFKGQPRREAYCSGVSWKRIHEANRYPDYFKESDMRNPISRWHGSHSYKNPTAANPLAAINPMGNGLIGVFIVAAVATVAVLATTAAIRSV